MRASKSKSDLKNTSSGGLYAYNQLWAISWATNDTAEDLGDALWRWTSSRSVIPNSQHRRIPCVWHVV